MPMKLADREFLNGMVEQFDESIKQLAIQEKDVLDRIGNVRAEELREFWKQELTEEEERFFRMTMDYWDKKLIQIWGRTKRIRHTRAEVGHSLMKSPLINNG